MPNYNENAKSFINGLSDFWLLYFKEIDQLKAFYQGTEILVGQSYLDLMALLLNNSVQDAPLFNKEFFKLLQINETDIKYSAGTTSEADTYFYALPDNIVTVSYLNNKIISPTAALDRGVDFNVDTTSRALRFKYDPTNAYYEKIFGSNNSEFTLRSKVAIGNTIRVHLQDTGSSVSVLRDGWDIVVSYDGPANSSTTTAANIVSAINRDPFASGILIAELSGLGTGNASPAGTSGYVYLDKVAANPLDGFASRQIGVAFGGKLSAATVTDWVATGVNKGDILRLIRGPTIGVPQEWPIDLVRSDALYFAKGSSLDIDKANQFQFAVLRKPADAYSTNEPLTHVGTVEQSGIDGAIVSAARTFSALSANFSAVHQGDLIEVLSIDNTGYLEILEVIDANTVFLASTALIDETPVAWNLLSIIDSANIGNDGVLDNNGNGTANFTSVSAAFTPDAVNTVIKLHRSTIEKYLVLGYVSATELILEVGSDVIDGTGLAWGWANKKMPTHQIIFSPPIGWPEPNTFTITARRLLDDQVVKEGIDYEVTTDTGRITPLTIWRTSANNTVSYEYRIAVFEHSVPLQTGVDGTITPGSPATFTSPTAVFTEKHVGYALTIAGSGLGGANNDGTHFISRVVSPTVVELTADKQVPPTVDPNNGVLSWSLYLRASVDTDNASQTVTELGFWAPNALIDKFHLYNTFGYLINKFDRSSEAYRSLIRGIFQLFMLGPTLERFESAINTVAGLPVIRDDGEILITYSSEALQSGTDGIFDFTTGTFTAPSAVFTPDDQSRYIYVLNGSNANKLFKISSVLSPTEVRLETSPTSSGPDTWELTRSAQHYIETSRTKYYFDRDIPLRAKVTSSSNFGVHIFKAFEVITDIFKVTDYLETPTWWEYTQIPRELWNDQTPERRQSTPVLFENVVNPADDGRIGDPGFFIGADSDGVVIPSTLVRDDAGALDGILTGDPNFPRTNNVYFTSTTANFSARDRGQALVVDPLGSNKRYRIISVINTTKVQLEAFEAIANTTGLDWEIRTNALPKRNKAAYVVLNTWLKHHLLYVQFDISLLSKISASLIDDLESLVFVAKPAYTYIIISPSALFDEIIQVTETFTYSPTFYLGGSEGELITANASPLTVIGSSWRIGNWFRYLDASSTFAAPAATLPTLLGAPTPGYSHYLNKLHVTPGELTSAGETIHVCDDVLVAAGVAGTHLSGNGVKFVNNAGEVSVTFTLPVLRDKYLSAILRISGSSFGNNGDYTLGAITSPTTAIVRGFSVISETGLDWEIYTKGSLTGRLYKTAKGEAYFEDEAAIHPFNPTHVGDYIRRPYTNHKENQGLQIYEVLSAAKVRLALKNRVDPIEGDPDFVGNVTANLLTGLPGKVRFSKNMARFDRALANAATELAQQYFIVFTSGVNNGRRVRIEQYMSPTSVYLIGVADDANTTFYIEKEQAYNVIDETADWEHVREQVKISNTIVDLTNTPLQDANPSVNYTAYGVREPQNPTTGIFDATLGDTLYSIGMSDPRQKRGKSRTGKDVDLREEPIQITRT